MISVSVVIPCFTGVKSLATLVEDTLRLASRQTTPNGKLWCVSQIILVWDGGSTVLRELVQSLGEENALVTPVFQSHNFGQHSATVAGFSVAAGDWVATLDEDGSHNPLDIAIMIDSVFADSTVLCYATQPRYPASRSVRELVGKSAKAVVASGLRVRFARHFQSFRLVHGDVARDIAVRIGPDVYLDVALSWYANKPAVAPVVPVHAEGNKSSYTVKRLTSHFWIMFLSAGPVITKSMSLLGILASVTGVLFAVLFSVRVLSGADVPPGWASQIIFTLLMSGIALAIIGLSAEYLGHIQRISMGKPSYFLHRENPYLD